ncbi:methylase of polypeptide subunit release factors [Pseudoduganella flava]|uniref:Methylase of polypeptide subunit release factors n=1 Tax=Pseudoduganella flava TaxID=871742 RepID=A0A562PZW0_9BURK|nr:class I SAM-dependent methyltransferase [Pseudoduganella flava]QGZ38695.1 methyltransferase [Pseudoduganella flava]TWI49730.1 methylase of polypeptide subunit release factors [Pseudoduganella flava]
MQAAPPLIHWTEQGTDHAVRWHSEAGMPPPKRVAVADDTMNADTAYRLACEGTALLWRGDFQNARQLLQALARRADHKHGKGKKKPAKVAASPTEAFHLHRQAQSQRARTLAMLLIPFEPGYTIPLRRAPDVKLACNEAYGRGDDAFVISLRELLGLVGAHEWRKAGVAIPALGARIHPHYGVFSPVRGEYVQLVADTPLPKNTKVAFDIGAGTGVLSAVLARRGVPQVIATDMDRRALSCARENIARLGLDEQVQLLEADMFPPGRAPLVVCNPPWVPARPSSSIEHAVYDPESRMLKAFLAGLKDHLSEGGEGWLILSDLAEHLGLRPREHLLEWIAQAGLVVLGRHDVRPVHPKATDADDPLHAARAAEVTSLWRLGAA